MTTVDDRCRLFFFDFFTISIFLFFPQNVIGPDASENVLGHLPKTCLEPGASEKPFASVHSIFPKKVVGPDDSEKVLDRPKGSGRASWASGGGPGGLLGGPGGSGGRLGSVLGALGATLARPSRQSDFGSFF